MSKIGLRPEEYKVIVKTLPVNRRPDGVETAQRLRSCNDAQQEGDGWKRIKV